MKHKKSRPEQTGTPAGPEQLRRRAEAITRENAARSPEEIAALSPQEIRQILHELQVHQIELEIQNEELRRAQAETDASRARYYDLYDLAPVGYCTVSEKGLILESNLTAATLLGTDRGALVEKPITRFILKEDQDIYYRHRMQLLGTGEPQVCELRMVKPGSATIWARLETAAPDTEDGPLVYRVVISDITEQRKLQDSLAQTNRMVSMGLLAAGVAHEINNPLTFVLYNTETLAKHLPVLAGAVGRMREALREQVGANALSELVGDGADLSHPMALANLADLAAQAVTGTQRINAITKSLSFFSRPERSELALVDLNTAVEQAVTMAETEIKVRAVLTKKLGQVPAVMAKTGRLSQVFLNLLVNAAHAIKEGAVKANHITVRTWSESGQVFAEVLDTGCGIRTADLESVFEPFFTTKGPDRGTGLGLAIARNIVSEFGGDIHIESTVGNGTRVVVRLPVAQAPVEHAPLTSTDMPAATSGARGRILVVDDEKRVRSVVKAILASEHEIVTADSGRTAQELLRHDQNFDLVLCDLMMSDVSGIDLHAWLSESQPRLAQQLVFITGGVFTPLAGDYLSRVSNCVIQKPFDLDTLQKIVRELVIAAQAKQ